MCGFAKNHCRRKTRLSADERLRAFADAHPLTLSEKMKGGPRDRKVRWPAHRVELWTRIILHAACQSVQVAENRPFSR
jgi:hypothetical protein